MTSRRKALLVAIAALLTLLAGAAAFGPRIAGDLVAARLIEELARNGVRAEIGAVRVGLRTAAATQVCVFDPPPNERVLAACVDRVEVTFPGGGPLRGQLTPARVEVLGGAVYLAAEHGALRDRVRAWQDHLEASRPAEPSDDLRSSRPAPGPDATAPTSLLITNVDVRLDGQPDVPVDGITLGRLETALGGPETSIDAHLTLRAPELPAPLTGAVPIEWDVALRLEGDQPRQLQLHPEGSLQLQAPSILPGLSLRADGAGISWPYHLSVFGLELTDETMGPLLSWATATLTLRELTTDVDAFYMTNLEVSSPRVHVSLDTGGRLALPPSIAALLESPAPAGSDEAPGPAQGAAAEVPGEGSADGPAPAADDAAAPSRGLWADRVWWERIPQRIALQDLEVHATRPGTDEVPVVLFAEQLEYALRIFNFQLDVSLRGGLRRGDAAAGAMALQVVWGWESSNLRFDLDLEGVDLGLLSGVLCDAACAGTAGRLDLQARFREDERGPGMRFSGELALQGATLPVPLLQSPLQVPSLEYAWEAERSREIEPVALRFSRGDLQVGDARASVRPTLHGFRYDRVPPVQRIDLSLEIPEQGAQVLFDAVPASLQGPLAGTRLAGNFGLALDFPIIVEENELGQLALRIDEPTRFERSDATLAIESMPDGVDPRRLLGAFTFTFRGPEASSQRVIRVPAPPGNEAPDGALPLDTHPWARLDSISWYLIATQLYREDGRFFSNSGINWYQLRRVLEEAWLERALGRGASTITMQLVKNVLLSHDRTIERKLQELFLSYWVTRLVPKERLLEIYLNVIEWGPGIHGVVEAADHYFATSPSNLTIAQSLWLSAITPSPIRRSQQRALGSPPEWMQRQIGDLLRGLAQRGWISSAELQAGLDEGLTFAGHGGTRGDGGAVGEPADAHTGDAEPDPAEEPGSEVAPPWAAATTEPALPGHALADAPPSARLRMLIEQSATRSQRR